VIHSVVDFNLHIPANAFLVFTLTGLGLRASRTHDSSSAHASRPVGIILGSALLLIGISFGFLVVRSSQGYYPYYFAYENRTLQPLEKSIQQTEAGFEKDPQSPFSAGFLGDLYRSQANALKPGPERNALAQSAANWYLKASELNPWDDSLRIRQGMVDDLMGRFEEASLYYAAAIRQQPYNGFYYIALGAHYWRRGLLDESNKAYNRAANCAIGQQEAREALELLQEIIRKNGLKVETEPGIEQPHATLP
jgi:tetratricopeptide (TPR) repeat protein